MIKHVHLSGVNDKTRSSLPPVLPLSLFTSHSQQARPDQFAAQTVNMARKQAPKRFCLLRLATHFVSTVNEAGACIAEVLSSAVVGAVDKEP